MISRLFVVAPVVYVGVCYLYLYLVHLGFGGQSVTFASASDIFSISFGKVAPFYVLMLSAYIYGHLYQVDDPLKIKGREEFEIHHSLKGPIASFPVRAFPWIAAIGFVVIYFVRDTIFPVLLLCAGLPLYAIASRAFAEKNGVDLRVAQAFATFLMLTGFLLTTGYSHGFYLRYADIDQIDGDYPRCGEVTVLMPVGDRFIVALPDGQRGIAEEDCEVRVKFQRRKATIWVI